MLPDSSGSLNQHLSSSVIEEANKEVTAVLGDPAKRHPYLKISPEQKAIIVRYAVYHGIVNAVSQFSNDFPENSLKEREMGKTGRGVGAGDQWVKPGDGNWEIT